MNKNRMVQIIKKILFLPPLPTLLIAVPSFILVFYVLAKETVNPAITYISYIMSAYGLIITVTGIVDIVKWIRKEIYNHPLIKKILGFPLVERFLSETNFRTEVSLYSSLMINLLYAGIKIISGINYRSVWFGTLAVYYILLAVMRFSLLHHVRKRNMKKVDHIAELKICRLCGVILMILDWALSGIIILVVRKNIGFEYSGMLIYAMALYTFYAVITAIMNVIKFRRHKSPAISVAKVINLTAATGTGVSIIVLGMSVYMIVRTTNQINKVNQEG